MKINYIKQKHDNGCGIACISMITGKSYDEVYDHFSVDLSDSKKGIPPYLIAKYIAESGFDCIQKISKGCDKISVMNDRLWVPFADIHLVIVDRAIDVKFSHAIVMSNTGKLFNPWDIKLNDKSKYYSVETIYGFFQPKIEKRGK